MKSLRSYAVVISLGFSLLSSAGYTQTSTTFPRIQGETFAGRKVQLPDDVRGKIAVLIFGFTKASSKPTGAWAKRISAGFGSRSAFELYQLPVLEDVPRLIRGMVISGIKKGVTENDRDHFVPLLQGEAEIKKAVNYSAPDDAYLVILNREGKVVEQMHEPVQDSDYPRLKQKLETLLK